MISVDEHLASVLAAVTPTAPARVGLDDALGLVVAEDVVAGVDLPGFDNSSMDGYAVRSDDVGSAGEAAPVVLDVVAEVAAGEVPAASVLAGRAMRIMTGAPIPDGADAVVPVEWTRPAGTGRVEVRAAVPPGRHVRRRGDDITVGARVAAAGSVVDARLAALLAATGHGDVLVHRRPLVAVVSTGSELAPAAATLRPGQIHDANSHLLTLALRALGADVERHEPVEDSGPALAALLTALAGRVDAVVTSGGVSMGAYDVVKQAFGVTGPSGAGVAEVGTMGFVQVAMQPGKPQGLGRIGPRRVPMLALPGNPVSAYVSFEVFVRPAVLALMGRRPPAHRAVRLPLGAPLRSPAGKRQFARAVLVATATGTVVEPVRGQGSHFVADLSRADALVVVPEDVVDPPTGSLVEVWPLDTDRAAVELFGTGSGSTVRAAARPAGAGAVGAVAGSSGSGSSGSGSSGSGSSGSGSAGAGGHERLTHVRADGTAHMVDVSAKPVTAREAGAAGRVLLSHAAVAALRTGTVPKGDALAVARLAGIQAVKRTPELVPLAHPVAVHGAVVDVAVEDDGVTIRATVRTADRTGIEMEALTAVSVAGLALIDMVKAVDRHARLTDIRVTAKSGGRSGDWREDPVT